MTPSIAIQAAEKNGLCPLIRQKRLTIAAWEAENMQTGKPENATTATSPGNSPRRVPPSSNAAEFSDGSKTH
jgi:hypothetical protein